jgi:hypothetical protein
LFYCKRVKFRLLYALSPFELIQTKFRKIEAIPISHYAVAYASKTTLEEVAAVQVEVDDDALTKAIKAVKIIVRTSSRLQVDSKKA